ncbi:MAG TPA: SDR family NAD(P)-dependent oxidoreductase, partial [Acidimicrobiales bacterium]|nr:SDR family NAD(P)-dependent oxidoreductase [Acidimicrobiales bacterium]
MDLELTRRRALVTGSSRGIGRAVARQLAAEGADVVVTGRHEAPLRATAEELAAESGRRIVPVVADTGDDEAVRRLVVAAEEALGGVDILVNNAARPGGQGPAPTLAQFTAEALWEEVNVKVAGYLRCAQAVAPLMVREGWGRIVNISGLAARQTGS